MLSESRAKERRRFEARRRWGLIRAEFLKEVTRRSMQAKSRLQMLQDFAHRCVEAGTIKLEAPGGKRVPIHLQGDLSLYTPENLLARQKLKGDPDLMATFRKIWLLVSQPHDDSGTRVITRENYMRFFHGAKPVVVPNRRERKLVFEANPHPEEASWSRDVGSIDPDTTMIFWSFVDAVYELVDVWTLSMDPEEYRDLAERLLYMALHTEFAPPAGVLELRPEDEVVPDKVVSEGKMVGRRRRPLRRPESAPVARRSDDRGESDQKVRSHWIPNSPYFDIPNVQSSSPTSSRQRKSRDRRDYRLADAYKLFLDTDTSMMNRWLSKMMESSSPRSPPPMSRVYVDSPKPVTPTDPASRMTYTNLSTRYPTADLTLGRRQRQFTTVARLDPFFPPSQSPSEILSPRLDSGSPFMLEPHPASPPVELSQRLYSSGCETQAMRKDGMSSSSDSSLLPSDSPSHTNAETETGSGTPPYSGMVTEKTSSEIVMDLADFSASPDVEDNMLVTLQPFAQDSVDTSQGIVPRPEETLPIEPTDMTPLWARKRVHLSPSSHGRHPVRVFPATTAGLRRSMSNPSIKLDIKRPIARHSRSRLQRRSGGGGLPSRPLSASAKRCPRNNNKYVVSSVGSPIRIRVPESARHFPSTSESVAGLASSPSLLSASPGRRRHTEQSSRQTLTPSPIGLKIRLERQQRRQTSRATVLRHSRGRLTGLQSPIVQPQTPYLAKKQDERERKWTRRSVRKA